MVRLRVHLLASALVTLAAIVPLRGLSQEVGDSPSEASEQRDRAISARRAQLARRFGVQDARELRDLDLRAADFFARERERLGRTPLAAGPTWTSLGPTFSPTYTSPIGSALPGQDDTGLIAAIATHPTDAKSIVVGLSGGGLWKTKDGGTTWKAVAENFPSGGLQIGAVAYAPSSPSRMYAGTSCGDNATTKSARPGDGNYQLAFGLLVSNDGGDTWERAGGAAPGEFFWQIEVDRENADVLLAGVDKGLVRSTDAGKTWTTVITPELIQQASGLTEPATGRATTIVRSPSTPSVIYASVWGHGTVPGVVFKSTDAGQSFAPTGQAGLPPENLATRGRIALAVHPQDANKVYALVATQGSKQAGFARSTDGGATWQAVSLGSVDLVAEQGSNCLFLAADPSSPGTLIAGGLDVYRSTNDGDTWTQLSSWAGPTVPPRALPYLHADQHLAVFGADGTMYVGNDGGIFARTENAFKGLNSQIVGFLVDELCTNATGTIVITGNQDNGTAIMRENGRWDQIGGGDGYGCRVNPTSDLVLTTSVNNQGVEMSTDGGKTFTDATGIKDSGKSPNASFRTHLVQHPTQASRIFTFSKHKIWRSDDDGLTWVKASKSMPIISDISDLVISPVDGNRMLLVDGDGQVVESTDGGESWTVLGTYPLKGNASTVEVDRSDPERIFVASSAAAKSQDRVWTSPDRGKTWAPLSKKGEADGLPDLPVWSFKQDPVNPQVLWAGTYMGLYRSANLGGSWTRHGDGLPNTPVTSIAFTKDGASVFVGTSGRGSFRTSTSASAIAPLASPAATTPVVDFSYLPASPQPGRRVTFTDKSQYGARWSWDFGDGTAKSADVSPDHVFAAAGAFTVKLTVTSAAGESATASKVVNVVYATTGTGSVLTYLVPVLVRSAGAGGTSFGTELALTSRAAGDVDLTFRTKDGTATYKGFFPGQEVYPDVFAFLKENGLTTPDGTAITTLRIEVSGARDISQFGALARVTTPPNTDLQALGIAGRFGLAFPAIPLLSGASKEAVLYGLQQVGEAGRSGFRSNVSCAHAGSGSGGTLGLEVTYHDGDTGKDHPTKDTFTLAPFAFDQRNTPLASRGIKNGWATVRRVSGNDQFVCYATVLDNVSGDSSYVEQIVTDTKSTKAHGLLPVIVDTAGYKTELTISNRTVDPLNAEYVVINANGETEFGEYDVPGLSQLIIPDVVADLRAQGIENLPPGAVASMYFTFEETEGGGGGKLGEGHPVSVSATDVFVGGRTYSTKGGGQFGLAYPFSVLNTAAELEAYVYGLQQTGARGQDGGTRSNLAIVHALDGRNEPLGLEVTYFDDYGKELGSDVVSLKPGQWTQIGTPLARFTGVTNGYARVRRVSGSDEFYAYGILNDQANDDGSFVKMVIP